MASVPVSVTVSFLSVFLLPLSTLKAVTRDESLRDQHVSGIVALAAQAKLFRTRNELKNF
jgi:hypothetical protein